MCVEIWNLNITRASLMRQLRIFPTHSAGGTIPKNHTRCKINDALSVCHANYFYHTSIDEMLLMLTLTTLEGPEIEKNVKKHDFLGFLDLRKTDFHKSIFDVFSLFIFCKKGSKWPKNSLFSKTPGSYLADPPGGQKSCFLTIFWLFSDFLDFYNFWQQKTAQ